MEDWCELPTSKQGGTEKRKEAKCSFCSISNAHLKAVYVAAFGFSSDLPVQSGKPSDSAKVCNVIYALLHQQQRSTERVREYEDSLSRSESSLQVIEQAKRRLETRLLQKDKEVGNLENKVWQPGES